MNAGMDVQTAPLSPDEDSVDEAQPIVVALQSLANDSPTCFDERMRELAYLANVMLAGATLDGKRLRPADASNASLQTVAFGATLVACEQNPGIDVRVVSASELQAVLREYSADRLFRKASGHLTGHGLVPDSEAFVRSRDQLETLLASNIAGC
jgi:hypothetical protein